MKGLQALPQPCADQLDFIATRHMVEDKLSVAVRSTPADDRAEACLHGIKLIWGETRERRGRRARVSMGGGAALDSVLLRGTEWPTVTECCKLIKL
ncbi:hypothetical protein QQF64_027166 [Cirrhinus molitorella]